MILRYGMNQKGDTLVEVTLALAIMASVLTSAFVLTNKAIQMGRVAKERSLMVAAAQQQAELLTAYRDRVSWNDFQQDIIIASISCGGGPGNMCFHFDTPTSMLNIEHGEGDVQGVPTSKLGIYNDRLPGPKSSAPIIFTIKYEAQSPSDKTVMKSQVILILGDTGAIRSEVVQP